VDTNVFVAALRSRRGSSSKLLRRIYLREIPVFLSVATLLEYEEVLTRPKMVPIPIPAIRSFLNALCGFAEHQEIFYRWRPTLNDPKDEMFLELAVACRATHIVTHNTKDFLDAAKFGIKVVTPTTLLKDI
jgi:putative PIN family toxin of toxin-antitoxin system